MTGHKPIAGSRKEPGAAREARPWQIERCAAIEGGCPNALTPLDGLTRQLDAVIRESGWAESQAGRPLRPHNVLRVALAACPNACTRPQVRDIGLIASIRPTRMLPQCTGCGRCAMVCREDAIAMRDGKPVLDDTRCLGCGQCGKACPAGTMEMGELQFRVLLGGRMGRHPAFAVELSARLKHEQVVPVVAQLLRTAHHAAAKGETFGAVVGRLGSALWRDIPPFDALTPFGSANSIPRAVEPDVPSGDLHRLRRLTVRHLGQIVATASTIIDEDTSRAPLRTLTQYALSYLLEGQGRYVDAHGLDLPLAAGDIILVFPGVAHRYGPGAGQQWREIWMVFEGAAFDKWRAAAILDPARPVHHLEPVDHWQQRIESIVGLPQGPTSAPLLEFCRLQQFLAEVLVNSAVAPISLSDFAWGIQACTLLEAEKHFGIPLPEVARQLNMSYSCFRKTFTDVHGMSPGRYRSLRIRERACQLMQQTGLTNQQIADRLGFADEFHFSHRFKELTGRSPKAFRESLLRST